MPYTSTGPAMINILAAIPSTSPSLLNSMAGETMEFANPVMGTKVPAPACLAMLSYTFRPVRTALRAISVSEQSRRASLMAVSYTHLTLPTT